MTKRFLLEDGTEIFAPDDAVLTSDGLIYTDQEHKSSRPMTGKHQTLRDAAERSIIVTVGSSSLISLLTDHDRMREALEKIASSSVGAYDIRAYALATVATKALKECEQ